MGRDFHAYLEHYNHNIHRWEAILLLRTEGTKLIKIPFIEGGWGDGMDILNNSTHPYPPLSGILPIEENTLSPEISVQYRKLFETNEDGSKSLSDGIFGTYMTNLADIQIYLLQHPFVPDYNVEWPPSATPLSAPQMTNPLSDILESAKNYINIYDPFALSIEPLSAYRMIYWGDC